MIRSNATIVEHDSHFGVRKLVLMPPFDFAKFSPLTVGNVKNFEFKI
jgi:hypothetical protein